MCEHHPLRGAGLRRRTYAVLSGRAASRSASLINGFIAALIVFNVAALMVGTVESIYSRAPWLFLWIEWVSLSVFVVEYLARVWSCVESPRYRHWLYGRLRFALTPYAMIDLIAILPGLMPFIGADLRSLRLARILRILRLAKLGRYSRSIHIFGVVFKKSRQDLAVVIIGLILLLCIASSLMYFAENEAQPFFNHHAWRPMPGRVRRRPRRRTRPILPGSRRGFENRRPAPATRPRRGSLPR